MDIRWLLPMVGSAGRGANVIGAWLLTYAVHSTVLLLAAWWLVSRRRLRWSPSAQHAIWSVAMVAGWVTSAMQLASPWRPMGGAVRLEASSRTLAALQVTQESVDRRTDGLVPAWTGKRIPALTSSIVPSFSPSISPSISTSIAPSLAGSRATLPVEGGIRLPLVSSSDRSMRLMVFSISRTVAAVALWALVAAALLTRLALVRRRLHESLAGRRDARATLAGGALRHIAGLAGVEREVFLSTSDALPAPAAISGEEIVLPTRALHDLTLAEQEVVLAHELAHLVRRDTRWLRLATWIERLAWFQPLNRVARRQMQLAAEFAADAWAVRVTRQPLTLAQALARVAAWLAPGMTSPDGFAPGADGSPLVERVRRLTAPPGCESDGLGGRAAHAAMWLAAASALALLPRIDVGPVAGAMPQHVERFELRMAADDRVIPGTLMPESGTTTRVHLVRVGDHLRVVPPGQLDSVMAPGTNRRVVIVTERAAS